MAQVECVTQLESGSSVELKKTDTSFESTSAKKLRQGRLPFKPLDQSSPAQGNTPPGSKKRKLSDNESPSAKQLKTCKPVQAIKSQPLDGEAEVSSSSEMENMPLMANKGKRVINTLERFFKRAEPPQEEISSTNDCVYAIDLTEDMECEGAEKDADTIDLSQVEPQNEGAEKDKGDSANTGEKNSESRPESKANDCLATSTPLKMIGGLATMDGVSGTTEVPAADPDSDSKTNTNSNGSTSSTGNSLSVNSNPATNVEDQETALDSSFVSDPQVCELAIDKPSTAASESNLMMTPSSSKSHSIAMTPLSQSPGSASESTPSTSMKKKRPLSESKRKEREALRSKVKEQKEREREEKRLQKEKEKQEKELERLEKKKQKEQEKAEKEKQKNEEKEKKEKERLEKLQQKEEEKKKKDDLLQMKLEERKKKDDEKRLKDEEKQKEEDEKLKKRERIQQSFQSFFIKQAPTASPPKVKEGNNGLFRPFEMKPNMRLAPTHRNRVSPDNIDSLDTHLTNQTHKKLYLDELKSKTIVLKAAVRTYPRELEVKDLELMCHDEETIKKVTHKVKLLQFHENYRPPYYGTWTKASTRLTPRNPFKQDELLFDYEADSDDEWEEEEPGESVSSDENDEEKEEACEDEENDGWMVPHGHLSEDEGIDDDDDVSPEAIKMKQRQAQLAWENELRQQTQPMKQVAIGCYWGESTASIAVQQLEKLLSFKVCVLKEGPIETGFSQSETVDTNAGSLSEKGESNQPCRTLWRKKAVPEEAMPDLIRLVHGNQCGIKKLIKEFRMFWKLKTANGKAATPTAAEMDVDEEAEEQTGKTPLKPDDTSSPEAPSSEHPESVGSNKSKKKELEFAISKRQLELKIPAMAVREKRAENRKICWYVNGEVLKQYSMEDLTLPNTWEYVSQPQPAVAVIPKVEEPPSGRATPNILQFAQPMSLSQIQAAGSQSIAKDLIALRENNKCAATKTEGIKMEVVEESVSANLCSTPKQPNDQKSIIQFMRSGQQVACSTGIKSMSLQKVESMETSDTVTDSLAENMVNSTPEKKDTGATVNHIQNADPKGSSAFQSPRSMKPDAEASDIKRVTPLKPATVSAPSVRRITPVQLATKSEMQINVRVKPVNQDPKVSALPSIRRVTPIKVAPLLSTPPRQLTNTNSLAGSGSGSASNVTVKSEVAASPASSADVIVID